MYSLFSADMPDNSILGGQELLNVSIMAILLMAFGFYGSWKFFYLCSLILLIYLFATRKSHSKGKIRPHQKAILITGCDTGIGNLLAKRLDSIGFQVFASCLFPDGEGAEDLRRTCSTNLKVLQLDVTKDESVVKALTFVKDNLGSNDLWAVVNNAGLFTGFSFDFSSFQSFKDTFEVNALGPVRVTKAFLPLLKKSKGRVINMGSASGRIPVKDLCAYTMTKHALVAFTECLSLEMIPWGVRSISIEPEFFKSPINDREHVSRLFEDVLKETDSEILSSYGENYLKDLKTFLSTQFSSGSDEIDRVLDVIESAICDKKPKTIYKLSRNFIVSVGRFILEHSPWAVCEMMCMIIMKFTGYPRIIKK